MINLNENNCLLLVIDIQEKLLNAVFNKTVLEKKSNILSRTCSILNIPTIITEQYPKGLGCTIPAVKESISNAEIYEKTSFNALEEVQLKNSIKIQGKKNIILIGIETHICVLQSAKSLIENGYNVVIVRDSCGSRFEEEHNEALKLMNSYGAEIRTTEMVLFELLKSSKHPNFKEIQSLIK